MPRLGLLLLLAALVSAVVVAGAGAAALDDPATVAALRPRLAELSTKGYVILPAELISPERAATIQAELASPAAPLPRALWDVEQERTWSLRGSYATEEARSAFTQATALADEIHGLLSGALTEERLELGSAQARLTAGGPAGTTVARVPHPDGGYLTTTVALHGPGTVLYLPRGQGVFEAVPVPERAIAVITNPAREDATGAPTTLHASPSEPVVDRSLLVISHRSLLPRGEKGAWRRAKIAARRIQEQLYRSGR